MGVMENSDSFCKNYKVKEESFKIILQSDSKKVAMSVQYLPFTKMALSIMGNLNGTMVLFTAGEKQTSKYIPP